MIIVTLKKFVQFSNSMSKKYVINFNREEETFSSDKIYNSAKRAGASDKLAREITEDIEKKAYQGIKTSEIHQEVKKLLSRESTKMALRFNLKKAFKKLGPTGFPFEKYIGEVFSRHGFKVKLNQHISGQCGKYEIDFTAEKNNLLYIGECKYRNLPGNRVRSRDALANYARFLDIKNGRFSKKNIKSILVTNTKFTSKVVKYSECVGVDLLGWRHPRNKGLEYFVESQGLYPITILPSLNKYLAKIFVEKRIMLVKDLLDKDIKQITKLSEKQLKPLIKQAQSLLQR